MSPGRALLPGTAFSGTIEEETGRTWEGIRQTLTAFADLGDADKALREFRSRNTEINNMDCSKKTLPIVLRFKHTFRLVTALVAMSLS